jgi:hypothetical protein
MNYNVGCLVAIAGPPFGGGRGRTSHCDKTRSPVLPLPPGLISSIFRVKKSKSNPKSKLKPKRPKYGRNHGFEPVCRQAGLNFIFEPVCRQAGLGFKTIKTKNYIQLIDPAPKGGRDGYLDFYPNSYNIAYNQFICYLKDSGSSKTGLPRSTHSLGS